MSQEWDIQPRSKDCNACHALFTDNQPYFARLVAAAESYLRGDFCAACWESKLKAEPRYSSWQGLYRLPPPEPVRKVKKETAESLLRKFMETEDRSRLNVIFVLAVMLERKRILIERDNQVREDGTKIIVYEHRETAEVFMVPDPGLRLDQLEHVQTEVAALLGLGRKEEAQQAAAPPAAEAQPAAAGG